MHIVVKFKAMRSLATPRPPPNEAWWGGLRFAKKNFPAGPTSTVGKQCVATALRCARFQATNN
jgi:hypothetical protein